LGRALDAGPQLMVTGPVGSIPLPKSEEVPGPYLGLLGGAIPIEGTESLPPFLNGGAYSVTGPGGADVGSFTANITIGVPIAWTNRDATVEMNRSAGLPLTWSGGDASKLVIIGGISAEQESGGTAGFFCFVPAAPGNFTVPASVLANLPGGAEALGVVIVGSVPTGNVPTFSASGIEKGVLVNVALFGKTVTVR
jgi:hypothetical protein